MKVKAARRVSIPLFLLVLIPITLSAQRIPVPKPYKGPKAQPSVVQEPISPQAPDQQAAPSQIESAPSASTASAASTPATVPNAITPVPRPYQTVHALIVGNTNYSSTASFPQLLFAESDAREVHAAMSTNYGFNVTLLLGAEANRVNILREWDRMLAALNPGDDALFYFSGHGATTDGAADDEFSRTGYLIPYGATLSTNLNKVNLEAQAINARTLAQQFLASKGRHRIMMLDSCFAGLAAAHCGHKRLAIYEVDGNLLAQPSVQVLTAGQANEKAVEMGSIDGKLIQHGLFTCALLEAFRTENSHSMLSLFICTSERMHQLSAQAFRGRISSPQLRLLLDRGGEFFFVPMTYQTRWVAGYTRIADLPGLVNRGAYEQPITESEYTNAVVQSALGHPPDEAEQKHLEARASVGDPTAMAALVDVYGNQPDPRNQEQAAEIAKQAYETDDNYGAYALSRAYRFGYGVPLNNSHANNLERKANVPLTMVQALQPFETYIQRRKDVFAAYPKLDVSMLRLELQWILARAKRTPTDWRYVGGLVNTFDQLIRSQGSQVNAAVSVIPLQPLQQAIAKADERALRNLIQRPW